MIEMKIHEEIQGFLCLWFQQRGPGVCRIYYVPSVCPQEGRGSHVTQPVSVGGKPPLLDLTVFTDSRHDLCRSKHIIPVPVSWRVGESRFIVEGFVDVSSGRAAFHRYADQLVAVYEGLHQPGKEVPEAELAVTF